MTASGNGQAAGARIAGRDGQAARRDTRLIDGMWAGAVLIAVAGAALTGLAWSGFKANDAPSDMGASASTVAYASLGALIIRRVPNPIGWLLLIAGVRHWLTLMQRIFPDFHAIVEDEIAEGDRVVQRITAYGTHEGEFFGVPPTGQPVTFHVIEINRAGPDGRFVEHWSSFDPFSVLRRPGVVTAPPTADAGAPGDQSTFAAAMRNRPA